MIKIFLALSVIINLTLIAAVVGIMPFLLCSSLIVIILLIWYTRNLTVQSQEISQDIEEFYLKLEEYENHLDSIHSMEMFYGDQTLQGLIRHSREMLNQIYDFQQKHYTTEELQVDEPKEDPNAPEEEESILHRETSRSDS